MGGEGEPVGRLGGAEMAGGAKRDRAALGNAGAAQRRRRHAGVGDGQREILAGALAMGVGGGDHDGVGAKRRVMGDTRDHAGGGVDADAGGQRLAVGEMGGEGEMVAAQRIGLGEVAAGIDGHGAALGDTAVADAARYHRGMFEHGDANSLGGGAAMTVADCDLEAVVAVEVVRRGIGVGAVGGKAHRAMGGRGAVTGGEGVGHGIAGAVAGGDMAADRSGVLMDRCGVGAGGQQIGVGGDNHRLGGGAALAVANLNGKAVATDIALVRGIGVAAVGIDHHRPVSRRGGVAGGQGEA